MNWKKVENCQHEWTDYFASGFCATPYCEWTETHCRKCRVYQRVCRCGFESGLSGEPRKREMKRWARRHAAITGKSLLAAQIASQL